MAAPRTLLLLALLALACCHTTMAQRRKRPPPPPSPSAPAPPQPRPRFKKARPPTTQEAASPPPPIAAPPLAIPTTPPNIVVILVDDQDYVLNSTHRGYMPKLHQYIGDQGLHLNNFIVTTSLCCPSRVSLLTGKFTHNHNVTSNQAPQGSYSKWEATQQERQGYLPSWLKAASYSTYFIGKFMNGFDVSAGQTSRCPIDWDTFDPLTDKTVYSYTDFDFLPNCARLDRYQDNYQTDAISARSLTYIDEAVSRGRPFYLQVNPAAVHTACPKGGEDGKCVNPQPAARHKGKFEGVRVPRSSNWGVDLPAALELPGDPGLTPTSVGKSVDNHYQARIEAAMAVDDMVEAIVNKLSDKGILDNTYVIYVSDNGYHLGNHGIPKGKYLPYEEDIRVPFYIRGPGIVPGTVHPYMASMVDLTSTIVALAGGRQPAAMDGIPLPLDRFANVADGTITGRYPNFPRASAELRDAMPIELWSNAFDNNLDRKDYRSVRTCTRYSLLNGLPIIGNTTTCYKYTVWCVWPTTNNYKELFDLNADAGEINNLASLEDANPNVRRLISRADAMLQALGYCKGSTCQDFWRIIHPDGSVKNLDQALDPKYDAQYDQYTRFAWRACTRYYDPVNNEVADPALGGVSKFVSGRRRSSRRSLLSSRQRQG